MNRKTKMGNVPIEVDGIKFDSKFEFKTYQVIRAHFPKEMIEVHKKVLVKPPTSRYPAKYWRCDFTVGVKAHILLIEAKGFPTKDFKRQMQMLDYFNPTEFSKVRIIQPISTKIDEYFLKSLTLFELDRTLEIFRKTISHIYGV
jgi:hypothetical protein